MLLLSKKEYARKARYGFVNGREPVNYVREIKQRFEAYVELGSKTFSRYFAPRRPVLTGLAYGNVNHSVDVIRRTPPRKIVGRFI